MKSLLVVFWLVAFGLIFLGAVFWISDQLSLERYEALRQPEVCVSSMMVEADGQTVTNPVTCE